MRFALPENEVRSQLDRQLTSFFSISDEETAFIDDAWDATINRLEVRFSLIKNKCTTAVVAKHSSTRYTAASGRISSTLCRMRYIIGVVCAPFPIRSTHSTAHSAPLICTMRLSCPMSSHLIIPSVPLWAVQTTPTSLHSPRDAPWETTMAHTRGSGSEYSC